MGAQTQTAAVELAPTATRVRWKIFFLMLFLVTINYVDRASISVAMPLIGKEFNIGPAVQGLVLSSFFWTYALMQIPGGMLADKHGPRVVIAAATFFWGLFQALAAASLGWFSLFLTRLGLGASEAPIYPAGGKLNAIWMTQNERGRGATLLDGGAPLGSALGAILISFLIALFDSWRTAFIIAGVGTMVVGLWAWRYIRNNPRQHPQVNDTEASYIEASHERELATEPKTVSGRKLDFFKYRSVWGMFFGWMFFNTLFYGLLTWVPSYLSEARGLNIKQMGGAVFIMFFAGFIGELVGGWLADKWRAAGASQGRVMRTLCGTAAILATISIFSVTQVTNPVAVVVMLSATLFFLRWCGLYWCVPSILGTKDTVGFLGGTMNLGGNIAGVGVPIAIGLILQATGSFFWAFMLFAAAGVGLFVCSTLLIDYSKKLPV
jgi:ACS family D-galactonate transporter-like MFS transporter